MPRYPTTFVVTAVVTKRFSTSLKQQMIARLTGVDSVSAARLARETGISQQNLSRWLSEARGAPLSDASDSHFCTWTVEQKARILARAELLTGDAPTQYLHSEGVQMLHYKRWRLSLEEAGEESMSMAKRIAKLERELVRRERALAEAATLLILRDRIEGLVDEKDGVLGKSTERKDHLTLA
jgi:transposase